ncbi:MAG: hypothetical protein KJ792_12105 [Actinobacteria bacterium]|nr:hypothetical protein [Actinomycetota bacterium]
MAPRTIALVAIVAGVVISVGVEVGSAVRSHRDASSAAPSVASTPLEAVITGPHILFRNTLPGAGYGLVAAVPLADPTGPRAFTTVACDTLARAGEATVCLRTVRGVATTYEAATLDAGWATVQTWPLSGIPSSTRSSPDGTMIATTAYIANHCSTQIAPPTETRIRGSDGTDLGNLESWTLLVDGAPFAAVDRNLWDVSFVDDDTFYVTVGSQSAGTTWLATGTVSTRTITSVRAGGQNPAVSPDGSKVAYTTPSQDQAGRTVQVYAVLDVGSGTQTLYPATEGGHGQVEWLDGTTFLYAAPRTDQPATTDVWALDTSAPDPRPQVLIAGAWSPTVVRSTSSEARRAATAEPISPSS